MIKQFKFWLLPFFVTIALGLAGCGEIDSGDDSETPQTGNGSGETSGNTAVASLGVNADKQSVQTDGNDFATLSIRVLDGNNAALEGAEVALSTTAGALSNSVVTTDENGRASATFDAGLETANQVTTITASAGSVVDTVPITILGTTVDLTASQSSVLLNAANESELTITVRDGAGNGVGGQKVTLTTTLGTLTEENNLANSGNTIEVATPSSGIAKVLFRGGSTPGTANISLSGPAGEESIQINVTSSQFELTDIAQGSLVQPSQTDVLKLTWLDQAGTPVSGRDVTFSTNIGVFTPSGQASEVVTTDANGQATATFLAGTTGTANVSVTGTSAQGDPFSDQISITVQSANVSRIDLQAFPSVVSPDVGAGPGTATLSATVRDAGNNGVKGVTVSFNIANGPGGGESLSPNTAVTNEAGIATSTFSAGGLTSAQNGVTITASVVSTPTVNDSANLTIGQQAARIVLGTTNKISVYTVNGLEIGYALPYTLVVTDTNGNPIPNQVVNLGLYPLEFYTGGYDDPTDESTQNIVSTFGNEDANRNGILDVGEDGSTSYPANGRLDPGNVASIPLSVTTDENGFAAFTVNYPKSYGNWVKVEIRASTRVSGSESVDVLTDMLSVMQNDQPYLLSPF